MRWLFVFLILLSNVSAKEITAEIQVNRSLKLNSKIHVEADKIQISIDSGSGPEIMAGQDKEEFWFWSKRYKPHRLFVCSNEEYHLSNLKTAYDPILIRQFLGLEKYDFSKFSKVVKDGKIYYFKDEKDTTNRSVSKFIVVSDKVEGIYIYHRNKMIISCEYKKYTHGYPSDIRVYWFEENKEMFIRITSVKDNNLIKFKRPNLPKINMAETK